MPDAFSSTPNEFIHQVASFLPRAWHPRYWHREQSYWTPVGSPLGKRRALINEEGLVEVDEAGFSLEPFILSPNGMTSWNEADCSCSLHPNGLPIPLVTWKTREFTLTVQPWVEGSDDQLSLSVRYSLVFAQASKHHQFALAVRPFQVNPPWQAFRNLGGRSPIHHITTHADALTIDGKPVFLSTPASLTQAVSFDAGGISACLDQKLFSNPESISDPTGLASAAAIWDIPTGATHFEITANYPYFPCQSPNYPPFEQAIQHWQNTLQHVHWQTPPCAQAAVDCFRTTAGHILINRDGPAIQPGPRRYTRSWVRDCVIMGAALAKIHQPHALEHFLSWYAPFQREDGFIPCVVDRDGVDWLVEHDSHGQFLWGIRELLRYHPSSPIIPSLWPNIEKTANFMVSLRAQRQTDAYRTGEHAPCFGLFPESASHEGYLAHPVHSYWDDFWGIRGFQAAADLADYFSHPAEADRWRREASSFLTHTLNSIESVTTQKNLSYIPGSVEWADFDPTATSNAIAQLDFASELPEPLMHAMLDTYLEGFRKKHSGQMPWVNYTAYEIRIISALVRLNRRDDANELLTFFLHDRRPIPWNQWPEITWKNPRSPGHLGDVPHTWIAAEFLLAVASMVASERESSDALWLASGIPWTWVSDTTPFSVSNLPTRYGPLSLTLHSNTPNELSVTIENSLRIPNDGLWLAPPTPPNTTLLHPTHPSIPAIRITQLPFHATIPLTPPLI